MSAASFCCCKVLTPDCKPCARFVSALGDRPAAVANPALTNAPGVRFELYDMTGNGDLTAQTNAPPFGPPFFQSSQEPGLTPELIYITTNGAQTNLNNTALTNLASNLQKVGTIASSAKTYLSTVVSTGNTSL